MICDLGFIQVPIRTLSPAVQFRRRMPVCLYLVCLCLHRWQFPVVARGLRQGTRGPAWLSDIP